MPNLGNLTGAELNSFIGRLSTNEANIAQNQVLISQLNSSSTANLSTIQTSLETDISSNTTAIGTNATDIASNATDIATNATAITTINTALSGKASKNGSSSESFSASSFSASSLDLANSKLTFSTTNLRPNSATHLLKTVNSSGQEVRIFNDGSIETDSKVESNYIFAAPASNGTGGFGMHQRAPFLNQVLNIDDQLFQFDSYRIYVDNTQPTGTNSLYQGKMTIDNGYFYLYNSSNNITFSVRMSNGYPFNTSDDRMKMNEKDIEGAIDMIKKLNPQTYLKTPAMSESDDRIEIPEGSFFEAGLIAQEVLTVEDLKHLVDIPDDSTQPYQINYQGLIPYLIAAVKELNSSVSFLEKEYIPDLVKRFHEQTEKNITLENRISFLEKLMQ